MQKIIKWLCATIALLIPTIVEIDVKFLSLQHSSYCLGQIPVGVEKEITVIDDLPEVDENKVVMAP